MRFPKIFSILAGICCMVCATSCDSFIYEDLRECQTQHRIHFVYDHNLRFSDEFKDEVPSVNLYIFDESGKLVRSESRDVTPEIAGDFHFDYIDLPRGKYDLLAWCGVKDSRHFKVNHNDNADPGFAHHTCRIERSVDDDQNGHVREDIGRLYHGSLMNVDMTQEVEGSFDHTINLKKNTNRIRVILRNSAGRPIESDDYIFTITESNGLMSASNDLMEDEELTYHPWNVDSEEASRADEGKGIMADFTVGRLMAGRNATLTVTRFMDGDVMMTVPLNELALQVKDHYREPGTNRELSDQEYLDRQDNYEMTFFLDDDGTWLKSTVIINSWRIVYNYNHEIH